MPSLEDYEQKYGPWTAHNIEYEPGRQTRRTGAVSSLTRHSDILAFWLGRFMKVPFAESRLLDLGCLEGGHTCNFARKGARTIGLEVREDNFGRCSFLKEKLPDLPMEFIREDLLNISVETLGRFDGILMSGLLYHLDAPDILPTLTRLREMTDVLLIDTHLALSALEKYEVPGHDLTLYGRSYWEHRAEKPLQDREKNYWSSYRNSFSLWLTEHSLVNVLKYAGFGLVAKLSQPVYTYPWKDRSMWIAVVDHRDIAEEWRPLPDPDPRMNESELFVNCLSWPANPSTQKL